MADMAVTNEFTDGTAAEATEVNTNFNDIVTWVNANAIRKDGTIAFTGAPSYAADPGSNNQLTRKSYVDNLVNARVPSSSINTFNPTLKQGSQVLSHTLNSSQWVQIGPLALFQCRMTSTENSSTTGVVRVELPVASLHDNAAIGAGVVSVDGVEYVGVVIADGSYGRVECGSAQGVPPLIDNSGDTVAILMAYAVA